MVTLNDHKFSYKTDKHTKFQSKSKFLYGTTNSSSFTALAYNAYGVKPVTGLTCMCIFIAHASCTKHLL